MFLYEINYWRVVQKQLRRSLFPKPRAADQYWAMGQLVLVCFKFII